MTNDTATESRTERAVLLGWAALGAALLALSFALAYASQLFGYGYAVRDMPVFWLAGGMGLAGALFLALLWLVPASSRLSTTTARLLLWGILVAGLFMRLLQFTAEPALEDDYQRYLWDGAVTAHSLNPYTLSPDQAKEADPSIFQIGRLGVESGLVLDRVNHPHLRTIYPPVAQAAFALSYIIGPWSIDAWRLVILFFDLATVALLLLLLNDLGRSPLWVSLYWWNPIAVKELFNAGHMEAVVIPLVLGGLALAVRKRPIAATASLTLAAGAKLWPVILLPLVWRSLMHAPRKLLIAVGIAALGLALFAWPILSAGLDPASGFVAYASKWKTNSALFPALESLTSPMVARAMVAMLLAIIIGWQCRTAASNPQELTRRALIIISALFLLSPAQFPWYFLWVLPLLCIAPVPGLLVLTATLPLYYTAFYFLARGDTETFPATIVWLIWLPAWGLLLWQARDQIQSFVTSQSRKTA